MATSTAAPQDAGAGRRSSTGPWAVVVGAVALVILFVAVARPGGGGGDARVEHVQALIQIPEEYPPGWWSLDLQGESALLLPPTGFEHAIGEVVRFDGDELELGPHPDCDDGSGGRGLYDVTRDGNTVTFDAVGTDGCRPRQELLTSGQWRTYTPPPRTTDLPEARPAEIVATVPVDGRAAHLTVGAGSVWVATIGSRDVFRIDPATNAVTARVDVGYADEIPALAYGEGAVWMTSWLRNTVSRVDPGTNQVTATIDVGVNPPGGILAADGEVWVANGRDGTVSRVDARRRSVTDTVELADVGDAGPQDVVAFRDQVLVTVPRDSEIASVDPRTGEVTRFFSGRVTSRIAATSDAVWVIEGHDATWVTRIGADGAADLRVGVGERRHPQALAATDDVLWVLTTAEESPTLNLELLAIDARTGEVTRRSQFSHMTQRLDIVVDEVGDVWVTAVDAVLRIDGTPG